MDCRVRYTFTLTTRHFVRIHPRGSINAHSHRDTETLMMILCSANDKCSNNCSYKLHLNWRIKRCFGRKAWVRCMLKMSSTSKTVDSAALILYNTRSYCSSDLKASTDGAAWTASWWEGIPKVDCPREKWTAIKLSSSEPRTKNQVRFKVWL